MPTCARHSVRSPSQTWVGGLKREEKNAFSVKAFGLGSLNLIEFEVIPSGCLLMTATASIRRLGLSTN